MANLLLTGTWGKETFESVTTPPVRSTTAAEVFDLTPKLVVQEMENNKFAKFNKMQKTGKMVLTTSVSNYGIEPPESADNSDIYLTTHQVSYGVGTKDDSITATRRKLDGDMPIALGRSGRRIERGLAASGLLGEKLNLSEEPSKNTFVQRVWLYEDDKALYQKIQGRPTAAFAPETSLQIGEMNDLTEPSPEERMAKLEQFHGRVGCDLRFNPVAKNGYKIFYDDQNGPEEQLLKHYKL